MKKTLSIFLALVITLALTSTVFATTIDANGGTNQKDVEVKIVLVHADEDGNPIPDEEADLTDPDDEIYVYHVEVEWDNLQFVYTATGWNPTALSYDKGSWDKASADVTVTNKSNAPVDVTFKWESEGTLANTVKGATFTMEKASAALADASKTVVGTSATNTITVSGKGDAWTSDFTKFDTIIVTVDSAV
ncbi:MAG TPA: hypothetical protein VFC76_06510 [Oscillospiraceae bacterium]|nr:hypothetical protein [Oscillospiraceae bacterium]